MFYKKEDYGYFYFKSDKDNFWFGPFEGIYFKGDNLGDYDFSKYDLKSYKNLAGKWFDNIYIFEYLAEDGLLLLEIKENV